jgi:hypothetical protein
MDTWLEITMLSLYPQKLALTSSTSGSHSVGGVCLRTKATVLLLLLIIIIIFIIIIIIFFFFFFVLPVLTL